jgi:hypothetical protein
LLQARVPLKQLSHFDSDVYTDFQRDFDWSPDMTRRAAAYVRVSISSRSSRGDEVSYDKNPEVQEEPIRALNTQRGWSTHRVYSDRAAARKKVALDWML